MSNAISEDAVDRYVETLFPSVAVDGTSLPAAPFVQSFVKRNGALWCLRCNSAARMLPHRCDESTGRVRVNVGGIVVSGQRVP